MIISLLKRFLAITCLFLGANICDAQMATDTVRLDEVVVTAGSPSKYLPGHQEVIIKTDSLPTQGLTQTLEATVPVYFVQYGAPGQLVSINLRGLGASRTSLRWQGMEINSFTLGQTDFSQYTTGNADQINMQLGGVGSMYGNGALGGTIELDDNLEYNKGHEIALNSSIGSFGYQSYQVAHRYSGDRVSSATRVFGNWADNDFKYRLGDNYYRQSNAAFRHYGVLQDLEYRLNDHQTISLHLWYNHHFREVQPNKSDFDGDEKLKNKNTRVAAAWHWQQGLWKTQVNAGFTDDYQRYNDDDLIRLIRWFSSAETEWNHARGITVRFGGNINYLRPDVDSYHDHTRETRSELFAALLWERVKDLSVGFSARAPMVDGNFKALSPLLSGTYQFVDSKGLSVNANFQVGNSYRLPTMNDRYWVPGGNPQLKAETSSNLEAGANLALTRKNTQWEIGVQAYRHLVDNWIIWIPGGSEQGEDGEITSFWYPENIREVLAKGFEYDTRFDYNLPLPGLSTVFELKGAYNRSINQNSLSPVDRSKGKQLPYTPKQLVNMNWQWTYQQWHLAVQSNYRSERFVESNNELPPLSAYWLWNFSAGRNGQWGRLKWAIRMVVENAFDHSYQAYENRAMPGRGYKVNISINYN